MAVISLSATPGSTMHNFPIIHPWLSQTTFFAFFLLFDQEGDLAGLYVVVQFGPCMF